MQPSTPYRYSIFFKFAGWLSLSILLGVLTTVVVQSRINSAPIEMYLENMATDLSKEISKDLAKDIWNLDDRDMRNYFSGNIWEHLGIVAVRVCTEFDDVIYEKKWSDEPDNIFHRKPVFHNGKIIGYIEVRISKNRLFMLQNALEQFGFITVATVFVVIWLVCLILINLIIVRPLQKTILGVRKIAGGVYGYQLPRDNSAEIDNIVKEINAMSVEILKRRDQLEKEIVIRRKTEQALSTLNDELDQRVKDRTQQLRRMASMLASAQDAEQRRIAEGLHDDVAQLIAASRLKLRFFTQCKDPEKARHVLDEIDNLMAQANMRVRHLSFELASSTLARLGLRAALEELCEGMSKRYQMNFKLHCDQDLGVLHDEIATVLFKSARELLFNVVKHAGTDTAQVLLSRENHSIKLTIEDYGKGFPQQQDSLRSDAGSGLGLFGIRERLEGVSGTLQNRIRTRHVHAHYPVVAAIGRGADMTSHALSRPIRILLADDHKIIRETLRDFLQLEPDMEVILEVADGQSAVEKTVELAPDIAILDIRMEKLDGIEATRKIKQARPDIHVLCCSMHYEKKFVEAAVAAGASGYMAKSDAGEKID